MSEPGSNWPWRGKGGWPALAGATAGLLGSAALVFPGRMNPDMVRQYGEAISGEITDRHPPIIPFLWQYSRILLDGPATMLLLNLVLWWAGLGAVAVVMRRAGRPIAGGVVLAGGLSPIALYYQWRLLSDAAMASALIAGFGCVLLARSATGRTRRSAQAAALLLLFLAALLRANAAFAVGPLVTLLFLDGLRSLWWRDLLLAVAGTAIVLVGATAFNAVALQPRPSGIEQSLQLYDLVGIARLSGDRTVLPPGVEMSAEQVELCYTPHYWDPLQGPRCGAYDALPPPGSEARRAVSRLWLAGIARHPLAYAEHRLLHFNSQIGFLVPALQCRFAPDDSACGASDPRTGRMIVDAKGVALIRQDYLKKSALLWPVLWITLALALLTLFYRIPATLVVLACRFLLLSGLLYGFGFALVGVATNIRYGLWTLLALQLSATIGFAELRAFARERPQLLTVVMIPAVLVVALGYAARLSDFKVLVMPLNPTYARIGALGYIPR